MHKWSNDLKKINYKVLYMHRVFYMHRVLNDDNEAQILFLFGLWQALFDVQVCRKSENSELHQITPE